MNDMMQRLSEEFKEIYFVQGQLNGRYPYSNSLLIGDYLIDTGINQSYFKNIFFLKNRFLLFA